MKHHTKDIAHRAGAIADREAELIYRETGDPQEFFATLIRVYDETLKEFSYDRKDEGKDNS